MGWWCGGRQPIWQGVCNQAQRSNARLKILLVIRLVHTRHLRFAHVASHSRCDVIRWLRPFNLF